jgi:hypothetical protein
MLIGKAARGGTATAVANVGQFTSIVGVAVSTPVFPIDNFFFQVYLGNRKRYRKSIHI